MNIYMARRPGAWFALSLFLGLFTLTPGNVVAEQSTGGSGSVMGAFNESADDKLTAKSAVEDKSRHQILFFMGVLLLVFVFATAYFGLAMAMFGKDVFIPHMISAGVTVFLATGHAVVAVVWFFPF